MPSRATATSSAQQLARSVAQRASTPPADAPLLQRLEVRQGTDARKEVRAEWLRRYRTDDWSALCAGIGSRTIWEDVGVERLNRFVNQHGVPTVINVLNRISQADLDALPDPCPPALFTESVNLVAPTQQQIERAYATFLANGRNGTHMGLAAAYVPGMFDTFRARMLANGGQYFDQAAGAFQRTSGAFRARFANTATTGAAFSAAVYDGQQVTMGTGAIGAIPNWQLNVQTAIGRELSLFLLNVPVPLTRPFTPAMRTAIEQIHAHPQGPQAILNGPNPGPTMVTLLNELVRCPNPVELLRVLAHIAAGAVAGGMGRAMNHLDLLAPAAPSILGLIAGTLVNLPFGNRAGGLRGHFLKHPLGRQPGYEAQGRAEAEVWMGRIGLAPNGLVTRAGLPNVVAASAEEVAIFGAAPGPGATPGTVAQMQALVAYLSDLVAPASLADATAVAAAHEAVYEQHVGAAFDGTPPDRYLYYDANNLKVSAHDGALFMVAAWNGPAATFDMSTGFLPAGGSLASFNGDRPARMADV